MSAAPALSAVLHDVVLFVRNVDAEDMHEDRVVKVFEDMGWRLSTVDRTSAEELGRLVREHLVEHPHYGRADEFIAGMLLEGEAAAWRPAQEEADEGHRDDEALVLHLAAMVLEAYVLVGAAPYPSLTDDFLDYAGGRAALMTPDEFSRFSQLLLDTAAERRPSEVVDDMNAFLRAVAGR